MTWLDMPPGPAQYLLLRCEAAAVRLRGDRGDVSLTATIIIAASLAVLAVALTVAIKLKVRGWIALIPGG
jgi:hypothetical protein